MLRDPEVSRDFDWADPGYHASMGAADPAQHRQADHGGAETRGAP